MYVSPLKILKDILSFKDTSLHVCVLAVSRTKYMYVLYFNQAVFNVQVESIPMQLSVRFCSKLSFDGQK